MIELLQPGLRHRGGYFLKSLGSHVESVRASDLFGSKMACWLTNQPNPIGCP